MLFLFLIYPTILLLNLSSNFHHGGLISISTVSLWQHDQYNWMTLLLLTVHHNWWEPKQDILSSQNLKLNYSKIKYGENELVLNGYIISNKGICLSRSRLSDIRHVVSFAKKNRNLIEEFGSERFLQEINKLPLRHRDLTEYPFNTVFQFIQYMCGYRAFLISLVDRSYEETSFQKQLQHLIRKLETQITHYTWLTKIATLNKRVAIN